MNQGQYIETKRNRSKYEVNPNNIEEFCSCLKGNKLRHHF
jgi:hypothetical protein